MSSWRSWNARRKTYAVLILAVVALSIAYALNIRYVLIGDRGVTAVDDLGEAVAAALAAAACGWAAARANGKDRLGWALMGISAALWGAGEVVWSIYEVFLRVPVPSPSLADAGFLAAVPFAVGGIRAFWSHAGFTPSRWRVWFDGVIVAMALLSTAWGFGLRIVWDSPQDLAAKAFNLAYPISDIVIGTVLILAIRRATHQQKGRMALLLVGVACYSIADSAFAYLTAQNAITSVGSLLDTGWFAGFLMIALAAIYPPTPATAVSKRAPLDLWQLALPWMTLLTASAGDFFCAITGRELDLLQTSLTASLALLLTVNMIIERREFLEMLTEIEEAHAVLEDEFKSALVGIKKTSAGIRDGRLVDLEEARRMAAEIHEDAERLDRLIDEMVSPEEEVREKAGVAVGVAVASREVVPEGARS